MVPLLHNCVFVFHFSITCLFPFSSFNCFSWTCYKLNFVILSSIIYYFLLIAAAREAVLFVVLEYSIRGIWYSLPRGITDNFELCACLKKQFIPKKKTEMQIKRPSAFSFISYKIFEKWFAVNWIRQYSFPEITYISSTKINSFCQIIWW